MMERVEAATLAEKGVCPRCRSPLVTTATSPSVLFGGTFGAVRPDRQPRVPARLVTDPDHVECARCGWCECALKAGEDAQSRTRSRSPA